MVFKRVEYWLTRKEKSFSRPTESFQNGSYCWFLAIIINQSGLQFDRLCTRCEFSIWRNVLEHKIILSPKTTKRYSHIRGQIYEYWIPVLPIVYHRFIWLDGESTYFGVLGISYIFTCTYWPISFSSSNYMIFPQIGQLQNLCNQPRNEFEFTSGNHGLKNADIAVRGWAEKFIGWLWCNGRIWPNVVYFST